MRWGYLKKMNTKRHYGMIRAWSIPSISGRLACVLAIARKAVLGLAIIVGAKLPLMDSKYNNGKWATSKFTMKNGFFVFKAEGQENN